MKAVAIYDRESITQCFGLLMNRARLKEKYGAKLEAYTTEEGIARDMLSGQADRTIDNLTEDD